MDYGHGVFGLAPLLFPPRLSAGLGHDVAVQVEALARRQGNSTSSLPTYHYLLVPLLSIYLLKRQQGQQGQQEQQPRQSSCVKVIRCEACVLE
jgi:hypothetical protein